MNTRLDSYAKLALALVLGAIAVTVLPFFLVGASSQDGRPATPVTVEGTVAVQGVVEQINDVLRQPFAQANSAVDSELVKFDIPDGKRLVIECVAFQLSVNPTLTNRVYLQAQVGPKSVLVPLPTQGEQLDNGLKVLSGNHPMTLRLDSVPGSANEVQFVCAKQAGGVLSAVVLGYLVDLTL